VVEKVHFSAFACTVDLGSWNVSCGSMFSTHSALAAPFSTTLQVLEKAAASSA
jgi:hypothetical protein